MAKELEIHAHWSTMIEGLTVSPKEFLSAVEESLITKMISDCKNTRVQWKEGGPFSAKREYLRITRKELSFDICGAPFGNGFFVSWWQGEIPSGLRALLMSIPFMGWLVEFLSPSLTYYKQDTASMFAALVHGAVLDVVDELTKEQGVAAVAENIRTPLRKDFFSK